MELPLHRVQQLLTSSIRYFNDEFDEFWVVLARVNTTEPNPDTLTFYTEFQQERETFWAFNQEYSTSISAENPCQCALVNDGNQCILTKEIPCDKLKFNCDCGNTIEIFVRKKTYEVGMNYDAHSDLISDLYDYLFASSYSVLSIDQPGYSGYVHTDITK